MPINIFGLNGEDQRITLTLRLWLAKKMSDHFFGHNPVFRKLQLLKQVVTGGFGTKVQIPIKYPAAGGPQPEGVQDPYTAMNHSAMTGITSTLWDVAQYRMPISAPDREMELQGSQTTMLKYIDAIMEIAMDRFMDRLNQDIWAAEGNAASAGAEYQLASIRTLFNRGGGSTTGPYSPSPLTEQTGNAVGSSAVTLVGGIQRNSAGAAYFCLPIVNPGSAVDIGKTVVNNLITLGTRNADKPDLLIVHRNHYDVLMGLLQAQRTISESKLVDYGFDAFMWRGCDVIFDDNVPTAAPGYTAFAINTKALKLLVKTMEPNVVKLGGRDESIEAWKANWFGQLVMTKMGRGAGARHANLNA